MNLVPAYSDSKSREAGTLLSNAHKSILTDTNTQVKTQKKGYSCIFYTKEKLL